MTWRAPTPAGVDGPTTGDDRPILEALLAWKRWTLLNICADLTADQLASRPLDSSNLSLLGLIRHLAKVERTWFRQRAAGESVGAMYDPAQGKDADFNDLDPAQAQADYERFIAECRRADEAVARMSFDDEFDAGHGDIFSLRFTYLHMISEYDRHNGHADLLRERIDGVTGR
jgi:uncharacterized damage-inducible protein DinB